MHVVPHVGQVNGSEMELKVEVVGKWQPPRPAKSRSQLRPRSEGSAMAIAGVGLPKSLRQLQIGDSYGKSGSSRNALNPEPQILNPEPETLNPEAQAQNPFAGSARLCGSVGAYLEGQAQLEVGYKAPNMGLGFRGLGV